MKFTLAIAWLLLCWQTASSQPVSLDRDRPIKWDVPRMRFGEVVAFFSWKTGQQVAAETQECTDILVGPIRGRMSPAEFLNRLTNDLPVVVTEIDGTTYQVKVKPIPGLPSKSSKYDLPRDKLHENIRRVSDQTETKPGATFIVTYLSRLEEDDTVLVGPLSGWMTPQEALLKLIANIPGLTVRAVNEEMLSVEPAADVPRQNDIRIMLAAPCAPLRIPPLSEAVMVERSRLPRLEAVQVLTIDRRRIEESGAASIPDVLNLLSQSAFSRPQGYRATGAQFAELRGLGAQYVKVLINGKPTFGSAADFAEGAFDLNSVPLSAVERIEVSPNAPSLAHGADGIGGMINIILRDTPDRLMAGARYEGARGGGGAMRGSVNAGVRADDAMASLVLDYAHTNGLLGRERSRWANQNFARYGGTDQRSTYASPPNVSTLDGSNLPGLTSPTAAVSIGEAGALEFHAGEVNRTSLLTWQSIVPDIRRFSLSAIGEQDIGSSTLRAEFIVADRATSFQYAPEVIPQFELGANHPQNPFGVPIAVSAAMTGLPKPTQEYDSRLLRSVVQLNGHVASWNYETYVTHSTERSIATSMHAVDPMLLLQSLSGDATALDVMSATPGTGGLNVLAPARSTSAHNGGSQFTARASGKALDLATVSARVDVGFDVKREFADYDGYIAPVSRNAVSAFAIADIAFSRAVKASIGTRHDDYDALDPVTSYQYSVTWEPTEHFKMRAAYNDAYLAPNFLDLYFPRFSIPTQIIDPARQEFASITIFTGGNPDLRPTVGTSSSIGAEFRSEDGLRASVDLWQMVMDDRIALVLPQTLLLNETALPGRVLREPQTAQDIAANRPGRLRELNITRANSGGTETRGVDLSIESTARTGVGIFRPRLDVTYTDRFKFNDLPGRDAPATERVGVASIFGTITEWSLRSSVAYEREPWKASVIARHNSCYQDFNPAVGQVMNRSVCPDLAIDLNVSRRVSEHVSMTIGATDLLNNSPPFSEINGPFGYDTSQGDLIGRTVVVSINGTL